MKSATFGEYIRGVRRKKNMTLTQLGAQLSIDSGALSKIENGKKSFDEKKLVLQANVFDVDIEYLKKEF